MPRIARITRVPVLIVGSGPVGLALAADLGWRRVRCTVVERNEPKVGPAKMILVGPRTMEWCRRLGFREKVINWGFPPDFSLDNVFVTSLTGYEIGRIPLPTMGQYRHSRFSPEAQVYCPQTWFDPIVRDVAASFPDVELRYQIRLEEFEQDDAGVRALVTDVKTGERELIHADYLIGCDGFASTVRRHLGIEMRGHQQIDHSINVELTIPNLAAYHDKGDAGRYIMVGPEGTWATWIAVNGRDVWRITVYGAGRDDTDQDIQRYVRRALGRDDVPYKINSIGHWVRRAVVADRFRDGRVFLAGDACHTHPPNGGFGMNTGIGDAVDLSWKLAAVVQGWGGRNLLDSYDAERRPACHRVMNESYVNYKRLVPDGDFSKIEEATPVGEEQRMRTGRQLVADNTKAWRPIGIHFGLIYEPSPIVASDETATPIDDSYSYMPIARPGSRAPHAWLPDGRSTLDLFRRNFTLLRFGSVLPDSSSLTRAARRCGLPLDVHDIADRNIADLYEAKMVLVRPDGHVAWRGNRIPSDPIGLVDRARGACGSAAAQVKLRLASLAAAAE